jgi:hypothetical protein
MTFTDDDLKRLKESLHKTDDGCNEYCRPPCGELDALLARLEAAEEVCMAANETVITGELFTQLDNAYNAWRKAAGK